MFGHLPELGLVLLIALIVFGPEKLPEVAHNVGKMVGDMRRALDTAINPEDTEVPDDFSAYYYESLARSGEAPVAEEEEEEEELVYWTREDTEEDVLGAPLPPEEPKVKANWS